RTGNKNEGQEVAQENQIEPARSQPIDAVRDHHRAAQQQKTPAAERNGFLEFVREDVVGPSRRRQQKRGLGRAKQGTVQDQSRGKDEHHEQRHEKQAKQVAHQLVADRQILIDKEEPFEKQRE